MGTARTSKDPVKSKVAVSAVVDMKRLARRPIRAAVDPMRPKEDNMMFVVELRSVMNVKECAVVIFRRSVSSLVAQLRSWFSLLAEQQRTEEQLQLAVRKKAAGDVVRLANVVRSV